MNTTLLINKYFSDNPRLARSIINHSKKVFSKAMEIVKKNNFQVDQIFLKEGSMLHDIGVSQVSTKLDKKKRLPYIFHGVIGRKILENEGLKRHALVAERHVGSGITKLEAVKLGLPARDMLPKTLEEKIICFADKFSSKDPNKKDDLDSIEKEMASYGKGSLERFKELRKLFKY